jgi:prepilin-type N-terminal cleavage/methylation domain-containing protein
MLVTVRRRVASERGFMLTEMLMVIAILGIISAAFALVFSSAVTQEGELREQSLTQDDMRAGVDRLAREVRSAYSTTGWPIETASASQVTFTIPDRASPPVLQRVSYRVSSGKLQRAWGLASGGTPTNWQTLVPNVTSTTPFSFLDVNGSATSTAASVRTVSIAMTFATSTGKGRSYSYTTSASPRQTP